MAAPLHKRIVRVPFRLMSMRSAFRHYYNAQSWGATEESVSGPGSSLERTAAIRRTLPPLLSDINAKSMLDIPCGDYHWMQKLEYEFESYIGADIVEELIVENQRRYGRGTEYSDDRGTNEQSARSENGAVAVQKGGLHTEAVPQRREFRVLDLTSDPLPRVDVILCRDCLVHLSLRKAVRAVRNITASQSTYLLATTFPGAVTRNRDVLTGGWRMLDLTLPPFAFPPALVEMDEAWPEWPMRRLGLWRIADLPRL